MENENQNNNGVNQGGSGIYIPQDVSVGSLDMQPESLSVEMYQPTPVPKLRGTAWYNRFGATPWISAGVFMVLVIGTVVALIARVEHNRRASATNSVTNVASQYASQQLPLAGSSALAQIVAGNISGNANANVTINGQLKLNQGVVITPSVQPNAPTAGQLYFDQNTTQLAYYNGAAFVPLGAQGQVVQSIGGLNGQVTLGGGLSVVGNQLVATNTGVLSVGGQAGAITVGTGLRMNGSTLQSAGVVSVSAGTPNLIVTDDGSGNVVISNVGAGTGTVTSGGGTAGVLPLFTTTQNIEDSLVSQSGGTVTVGGNLTVSGALSIGSPLGVGNGGTGTNSLSVNGVIVGQGGGALTAVTAASAGQCLLSTAGAPAFGPCPGGVGSSVSSLNGLTGALTIANATASVSTITLDDATTTTKGIASFNGTNFTVTTGAVDTVQGISASATPTFAGVNTNAITPSSALSIGAAAQTLTLSGNAGSTLTVTGGGFTTAVGFAGSPSGSVAYNFDRSAAAGTYNICTTAGNCAAGGNVSTAGGTNDRLPRFNGAQSLTDSSVSDDGSTVTILGTANLLVQGGTGTFGTLTQAGSLVLSDGSSNTVTIAMSGQAANRTYTLPDVGGNANFCLSTGNCVGGSGGAPNSAAYLVATLDGTLSNERALASGTNISLTDGGANGNMTVATVNNPVFSTSVTTPALQSSGALTISSAAGTTVALDAGTTIELQDSTNITGALDVSGAFTSGTGNAFQISAAGAITSATGITSSGTITFSGLNCSTNANGGALTTNGSGQLICSDDDGGSGSAITGSGTSGTVALFNGTNSITNSIITQSGTTVTIAGDLTLNTALSVANGGTGAASFTSNGIIYGNGTGALQVTAAGTGGQILLANGSGVPTFMSLTGDVTVSNTGVAAIQANSVALGTDTTGNYVANLGTLTGLSTTGNTGEGSTPTLSVDYGSSANTAVQGNTTLTCPSGTGNLTGGSTSITLGTGGSCGAISTVNNPTFSTSVTTPSLIFTGAGSNGTLQVANLANPVTFTLPDPGVGSADICLSTGNCAGAGSGVTTSGGTTNRLSKFTGSQALGDSLLSDDGTTVTINGTANFVVQGGTGTFGTLTQAGTIAISDGSSNTVSIVSDPLSADRTYTLPDAGGPATFCLSTGNCVGGGSGGAPNSAAYLVATLDGTLTNERALAAGTNISVTDGGANGNMTVATVNNPVFSTSVTTPALQSSGALTITSAAGQTIAIDAGTTIELQDSTNVTGSLDVSASFTAATGNAFNVNSSGAITAATGITSSGTITFSGLNCSTNVNGGALTTNGSGQLICSDDDGGAASTITGSGTTGTIPVFSGTNALGDSIITQSGTSVTIAGDLTLNTALTVANGGTGAGSFTSHGLLFGNGTGAVQVTAAGTGGQVLIANGSGVPTFVSFSGDVNVSNTGAVTIQPDSVALGTDTTGNYVASLGTLTGLSVTGNTGEGSTPALSVTYGSGSNTAVQGSVTLTCPSGAGNLTGGGTSITLGTGGSCASIDTVNNPSFSTSVTTPLLQSAGALTLTPGGALTIGATNQSFTVQGNGSSVITATNSGFVTTVGFTGTATGTVRYNLDQAATPGTYNICTSAGNCPSGGNVSTSGGTTDKLAKFTSGTAIGDSIITDNGTLVSVAGNLSATTLLSATLDTASAVALNIGAASPTTTAINLNQNTTLAAGKSLTITGGNTASRPGSPAEGMVYYDSTIKSLLVYANGKWQADRTTANKIVAMGSPSSCTGTVPVASANPDGADFVVNSCTSAQTTINNAIAALPAGGGTVYLMDGTYIIDGAISLPSNVTLSGAGSATTLELKDSMAGNWTMITNANTSTGNARITVRDLRVDANQSHNLAVHGNAVNFVKVGSSTTVGAKITGVNFENQATNGGSVNCANGAGVYLSNGANSVVSDNAFYSVNEGTICLDTNSNTSIANNQMQSSGSIFIVGESNNMSVTGNTLTGGQGIRVYGTNSNAGVISNNTVSGSSSYGLSLNTVTNVVVSGNKLSGSSLKGIYAGSGITDATISGNVITSSTQDGIYLDSGSVTNVTITGNDISNSGAGNSYNGISVTSTNTTNVSISNNTITDTAGLGYAISISAGASKVQLSNNRYSGTGAASIGDSGTDTIYANQQTANNDLLLKSLAGVNIGSTNSATASLSVQGGLQTSALPTPNAPTVTASGTVGSTQYRYAITALDGVGGETLVSADGTVGNGNATLTVSNYNTVTWPRVGGAISYNIYRTSSAGTPSSTGLIGNVPASNSTMRLDDTGLAASGSTPVANTTGAANIAGILQGTTATFSGANTLSLGTTGTNTGSITFKGSTAASGSIVLVGQANPTGTQTITLPNATGTVCLQGSVSCGFLTGSTSDYIQNQNASQQASSNFWISGNGRVDGIVQTPVIDTATATALNIGAASPTTTAINLNQNTTLAAGKSLRVTGGNTASRPGSPSEGMVYYDTTTKALLVYANGKWQADRSTAEKIVAMGSPSSCTGSTPVASANPDGADYIVNSCTSAQTTINTAMSAVATAGGGTVYLMGGTYILDGSITVPSNVTLAGAGSGATILKLNNGTSSSADLVVNSNTSTGNDAITVRDLTIDGNKTNVGGSNNCIYFEKVGTATTSKGGTITGVVMQNCSSMGILIGVSYNITIAQVRAINDNIGISTISGTNTTVTGSVASNNASLGAQVGGINTLFTSNVVTSNGSDGIGIFGGTSVTVTGNTVGNNTGNGISIWVTASANISGNTIYQSGSNGIDVREENSIVVSSNVIYEYGSTASGINVHGSSGTNSKSNSVTDNTITDSSGSGYAINIADAFTVKTYLSNNTYSGTGAASIHDLGVDTIYANQVNANGDLTNRALSGFAIGTTSATSSLTIQGGVAVSALPAPAAPTLTTSGTAGSTSYTYAVSALDGQGETLASTGTTIATGNATLTIGNKINITWPRVGGALSYKIYRTASGGTPSSTGLIGTVTASSTSPLTFSDTGIAASGGTPSSNTTGGMQVAGVLQGSTATFSGANTVSLGTTGSATGSITFKGSTAASGSIVLIGQNNPTGTRTITLPDATGTVCLQTSVSCGFLTGSTSDYIQNQNAGQQATSNFWISGTGRADTAISTPQVATASGNLTLAPAGGVVNLASNADLVMQGATAYISNSQGKSGSEAFGLNATAAGVDSVIVGNGATGHSAGASTAVGASANAGVNGTSLGDAANAQGNAVALGVGASADSAGIAIGVDAVANQNAIAIGRDAVTTANNQLIIGSGTTNEYINRVVIGSGDSDDIPIAVTIQGTSGSGSNVAGANVTLAGGQGTGTGVGGDIILQSSVAGTTGSTTNSLTTVATFSATSGINLGQSTTVASGKNLTITNGTLNQTYSGTSDAETLALTSTSGTQTNGFSIIRSGAAGTTTNGLLVAQSGSGVLTNGLSFSGTIGADINRASGILKVQGAGGINLLSSGGNITIGTIGGDTTGTLLVLGTKTTSGDPTGTAGAIYYNSSSKNFRCYEVDHWGDCLMNARTGYHKIAELGYYDVRESDISAYNLNGTFSQPDGETGHPGILQFNTDTSASAYLFIGSQEDNMVRLGNGDYWRYETDLRLPSATSALSTAGQHYIVLSGFIEQVGTYSGGSPVDGCYFAYSNDINSGKWQGVCHSNSAASTCDSTIAAAMDTWYRLSVVVNAAGTQANFLINGVSKCTVSTNIPTGAARVTGFGNSIQKTLGGTSRDLDNDYIEIESQFGTPR